MDGWMDGQGKEGMSHFKCTINKIIINRKNKSQIRENAVM